MRYVDEIIEFAESHPYASELEKAVIRRRLNHPPTEIEMKAVKLELQLARGRDDKPSTILGN